MMLKLLGALAILASVSDVCLAQAGSACYGTDLACDYYSLQCPSSQIIRLYNLYAGYKSEPVCGTSSNNHCSYSSLCCSYKPGDVYEIFKLENTYNTYTNCSGRQFCQNVQAPWQLMQSLLPSALTSTYVQIEYGCEPVSSKIPLCGGATGSVTGVYTTAEIMFDGSVDKFNASKASRECKCTVENTGQEQNVVFRTVDVRLESYFKSPNQSTVACSSAVLSVSNALGLQCADTSHHYDVNFYYNNYTNNNQKTLRIASNSSSEIVLTKIHKNGEHDSPAMVWISLQAEVNKHIRVTCEEVIPAQFTTTTTTTTVTTTTTPTSTTTTPTTTTTTPSSTTTPTTTTTTPTTTTTTPTTTTPTTTTTTPTTTTTTSTTTTPTTTTTTPTTTTTKPTTTTTSTPTSTTPTTTTTTPTTSTTPSTTTTTSTTTSTTTITTTPTTTTTSTSTTTTPTTTTTTKPTTTSTTSSSTSTTTATTFSTKTLPTTTTIPIPPTVVTQSPTTKAYITSPSSTSTVSSAVPPVETTVKQTSTYAAQRSGGASDDEKHTRVILAIIIPIIIGAFIILFVILWVYWRRTSPKRRRFNFMRDKPKHKVYQTFRNSKILDQFIDEMGIKPNSPVVLGQEKLPLTQTISVPYYPDSKPQSIGRGVGTDYNPNQSFISNGTVTKDAPHIQPYVISVPAGNVSNYSPRSPSSPVQNVVHVRMGFGGDKKAPAAATKEIKPDSTKQVNTSQKEAPKDGTNLKTKGKPLEGDGSVLIHVDNLSLPPVSPKPSSVNTSSNRSEMGSTPRELTPERRNSEPALIDTEPYLQRNSASAYVLPGTSPEDSSVLFVTNM